jgi:hypothetical protein
VDGGQNVGAVFGDGGDVAPDCVPVAGDLLGAELAGYLLLGLSGSQIAFCLIGGGWDPQVGGEAEHVVLPVAQAFQQVAAGLLFAAGDAGNLGQAEQDAMLERMDQGRGDLARDGGKALSAGGVRGVDEFLEGLADLDGPVRIRVGLGGAGQVAQDVLGAELVDQAGDGVVVLVPVVDDDGPAHVGEDERFERLHRPVAEEVIGEQVRTGDQEVLLADLRARADPASTAVTADQVKADSRPKWASSEIHATPGVEHV